MRCIGGGGGSSYSANFGSEGRGAFVINSSRKHGGGEGGGPGKGSKESPRDGETGVQEGEAEKVVRRMAMRMRMTMTMTMRVRIRVGMVQIMAWTWKAGYCATWRRKRKDCIVDRPTFYQRSSRRSLS